MSAVPDDDPLVSFQHGVRVIADWPPNIEQIREVLPVTERNIFAYNQTIYNPGGGKLPPSLIEHEKVHFLQQVNYEGGHEAWWERFLVDKAFRLQQEIPAHKIEWRVYLMSAKATQRNHRRLTLKEMAKRLSAPMYGNIISFREAKRLISEDGTRSKAH